MSESEVLLTNARKIASRASEVFGKRVQRANETFQEKVSKAQQRYVTAMTSGWTTPWDVWQSWYRYTLDMAERTVLFWDTLRKRGNSYLDHDRAGKPPVLHFDYEVISDARKFDRPVNYALLKITPPAGVVVDNKRRPYMVIDPRAGHGPGIGGFKDDSEIGVALREGHPVYFVMFYPDPMPGQTLLDVCAAEREFLRTVRRLHPHSAKPVVIGNCQGGWAAMMLATADPDTIGPLVINGAPMSYWGGAWEDEQVSNPMRYTGGVLGGSWLASFAADLGGGIFDGADLVQNFEYLNPANTFWDKYYHLYANIDTEPPRFLDFERWWGGFYLLNKEEMEWIVQNMFVGNKIWKGGVKGLDSNPLDLRQIRSPIVLFASMGDNITPPQQAFNWVADVYGSTAEIKANGQTIIGLVHGSIGHLGIFVSGKVATTQHAAITSVMKSIEALPPGLYAMKVTPKKDASGKPTYEVEFVEDRLEDVIERINKFGRRDEVPFEAAAAASEFNQQIYDTFVHPFVEVMSGGYSGRLKRSFHPMRMQRWSISDLNPWLAWVGPAADIIAAHRHPVDEDNPLLKAERAMSDMVSASLDHYRDIRDAASEAAFFLTYGNIFALQLVSRQGAEDKTAAEQARQSLIAEALQSITEGGYPAALARAGFLLARKGEPLPLAWLELRHELMEEYGDLLPQVSPDERRRISGRQEIICRAEPERAIETLPVLLAAQTDRERFLTVLDRLLADKRMNESITPKQAAMAKRIRQVCTAGTDAAMAQIAG